MSLDKNTVKNIAHLARIKLADDELEHLAGELSNIIGWVEQLGEVDTADIEPMTCVVDITLPRRADEVSETNNRDAVLANAPDADDGFYTVPKVIE